MSMKDDKFKQAISDLPEIEAPDVWTDIEKALPTTKNRKYLYVLLILIVLSVPAYFIAQELFQHENFADEQISEVELVSDNRIVEDIVENGDIIEIDSRENDVLTDNAEILDNEIVDNKEAVENPILENNKINIIDIVAPIRDEKSFFNLKYYNKVSYVEIGENLVRNPSFEDYNICPVGINSKPSRKLIPNWEVPSKGTPDYFNICSRKDAGVPNNFAGTIKPHSGDGYAGLILRQNFTRDNKITGEKSVIYREYIQSELTTELQAGKTYKITFWVCNSSNSRFAVDGIGACVTFDKSRIKDKNVMDLIPVLENPVGTILTNQYSWVAIEGNYTAIGGEKYLTIGNFRNNFSTNYVMQDGKSGFNYAYYYIDDVSLIELGEIVELVPVVDSSNVEIVNASDEQACDF